ncbi:hypothetical protein B0H13DRAFT_2272863 [Mycena leptocephala]|nr:hypothetical protein B0H13DRAFT_2272863 [Mycena leptocephala]
MHGSLSSQLCFSSSKQPFLSLHATPVKLSTSIQAVFICDQYFCFMYVGQHIQEFSPFPSQPHKLRIAAAPWERNRAWQVSTYPYTILGISNTFSLRHIQLHAKHKQSPGIPWIGFQSRTIWLTTANARRHSVQGITHNIRSSTTKVSHVNSLHLRHGRQRSYLLNITLAWSYRMQAFVCPILNLNDSENNSHFSHFFENKGQWFSIIKEVFNSTDLPPGHHPFAKGDPISLTITENLAGFRD